MALTDVLKPKTTPLGGVSQTTPMAAVPSQPSTGLGTGRVAGIPLPQTQYTSTPQLAVNPTASGGLTFNPSSVSGFNSTAVQAPKPINQQQPAASKSLLDLIPNSYQSPNGGTFSIDSSGNVTGYTTNQGYKIDTSGSIPSSALTSGTSMGDVSQAHKTYQDYVNAVSQAQGYSPEYIQALQGSQGAALQGAQLGLNSAELNSNFYTGRNLPGDTLSYAQGATAKAQAQNTLEQASNSIQQLGANQALNTQQLKRTGDISAAQTQLAYNPTAVAGQNAISQYNSLQQAYPAANIPEYNTGLSPATNQQIAQEMVTNSPAYRSQFQSTYQTPGGGTGIYNRLDTNLLQENPDGTIQLVGGAAAALGSANASSLNQLTSTYNELAPAFKAANDDFSYITQFMQKAGLNDANVPIVNQFTNWAKKNGIDPGTAAQFKSALASLQANYANVLGARGLTPTDAGKAAGDLIPANITPAQMAKVQEALNTNGQNILNATKNQISTITGQLGGQNQQSSGSLWDW